MYSDQRIDALLGFLKEDADDALTKFLLALEYIKCGNREEALRWMEIIFREHKNYLPNYYHFGKLLESLKRTDHAKEIYVLGIELAKKTGESHTLNEIRGALESIED